MDDYDTTPVTPHDLPEGVPGEDLDDALRQRLRNVDLSTILEGAEITVTKLPRWKSFVLGVLVKLQDWVVRL